MTISFIFYTTIRCFANLKWSSNVRVSTMANLKAEFHQPLLIQALNMTRRWTFVSWKVTWHVSYSLAWMNFFERGEQFSMNETAIKTGQASAPIYNIAKISVYKHWRHFRSRGSKSLVRVVGRRAFELANPLLTDEFPTRFSAGVDTRISFKLWQWSIIIIF